MKETTIRLLGKERRLKALSCEEVLEGEAACSQLKEALWRDDMPEELLDAICEHAVVGYLSVYDGENRLFPSAREVLRALSLEDLIRVYDSYAAAFSRETGAGKEVAPR